MPERRSKILAAMALGGVIVALIVLSPARLERPDLWGDEGTFVAMTASLAHDGDLVFDETDLERLQRRPHGATPTVILQRTDRGITYSKPLLYPLLAAPLFAVMGEKGLLTTNALALAAALIIAWLSLRPTTGSKGAAGVLATFLFASVTVAYLGWKMSDLALLSLTLVGLALSLGGRRLQRQSATLTTPFAKPPAAWIGGLLLGGAVSMRYTTAALAGAVVLALLVDRRWRRAIVVAALTAAGFLAVSGVSLALLGTANPYKSVRSSFNPATGYPAGAETERVSERFTRQPATQSATWRPALDLRRTAYSTLYFFIGRHTGVLFYFPAAAMLLWMVLRRPDRVSLSLLAGVAAIVGFYLVWMPENYFGGSTFVGNRYFLGAYPALLVALSRPPSKMALAAAWSIGLLAWGSALHSANRLSGEEVSSQIHAHAGLFRRLPVESTARRIDGQIERFWAGDYLRFVDPYSSVGRWSFRLDAERPEAEVLVATDWEDRDLHFVVSASPATASVVVRDWRSESRIPLPRAAPEPPGVLIVPTSAPWRRHAYWWKAGRIYGSRVLRFSLIGHGEGEASAVVRYAGRGRELAPLAAEVLAIEPALPTRVLAGTETTLNLRLRNSGRRPWRQAGAFPVAVGYRLIAGSRGRIVTQDSTPLPGNVPPGQHREVTLTLRWPEQPGSYQLALDLLRHPPGALGPLGRLVLRAQEIQIDAVISPDSPAP